MRVLLAIGLGLVAAGVGVLGARLQPRTFQTLGTDAAHWVARPRWPYWHTDRVARGFVAAVVDRDSVRIAHLSRSGSGHNILCAIRYWPRQHWVPVTDHSLYRVGSEAAGVRYRLVGFP